MRPRKIIARAKEDVSEMDTILPNIVKSSRHSKILGNFGESLILNWLSRSGFEVALLDHTGIDVLAYSPETGRIGISVKSRTRMKGTESSSVTIFQPPKRKKMLDACESFGCEPWIGVYVETLDHADLYLTSLKNYDKKYRGGAIGNYWKMARKYRDMYNEDEKVKHITLRFGTTNWFARA